MDARNPHEAMLFPFGQGTFEASLLELSGQRVAVFYGARASGRPLEMKISADQGRTWSESRPLRTGAGSGVSGSRVSPIRLKSGAIGILYTGPAARPGRDGVLLFRKSADEGETWSEAVPVDPLFAVLRNGCARVLRSGRILAPVFIWLSPYAGGESESESNSVCFSWVYYSDDEGQIWKRSLSELMVSINQGRGGMYSFEEPVVEELRDGRVLMFGRTELGRQYRSLSRDSGVVWSQPEPVNLASSYAPTLLRRIPRTGDLLAIWNQASVEEILAGLSRHRLSSAVSKDDGATWQHFRNLESLDDAARVEPPPVQPIQVYRANTGYRQPADLQRYLRAPGPLRICYASAAFLGDEVLVTYDYSNNEAKQHGTKVRVLPLDWFYQASD